MKGVITVIKIFAAFAVLGILGALILFISNFKKDFAQPAQDRQDRLDDLVQASDTTTFRRGEREFSRAVELIAMERLDDAQQKLLVIQNLHADSEFGPEARRILGEINLDNVLSVENMDNKAIHTVRSGETYLRIANKHETTLDCILFLNGLLDGRKLHPGDELIVMPLNFKLVVDLAKKRVELYHRDTAKKAHVFTKEYPIIKIDLPQSAYRSSHSKINSKVAEVKGRSYKPIHSKYRNGTKVLGFTIGKRNVQLRPVPAADAVDPGGGIFLESSAMEELAMLIRFGNEVEVRTGK